MMNVKLPGKETLTIQLLSEEDRSVDDAETTQERWAQYIESFALVCSLFFGQNPPFSHWTLTLTSEFLDTSNGRSPQARRLALPPTKYYKDPNSRRSIIRLCRSIFCNEECGSKGRVGN